ncbi:PREDICTED: uncharacterized protein C16orf95 homolog [Bison bison bison]|uniref:Uncharacterized protein C16orf95 homolog n=1 Tax=Bison bison bison TaxID=43346 RepID=A0A6P3I3W1_BISBB|nr:PREDICTED: uncharacterized protein C16orf95 homolog [Bison bison bison]
MCPVPSTVHLEPICCECQAKFGGYLPVPRAKAALPYWVPRSLRPQNQIQKMVRSYIPKTTKACPCPCHRFGGHLPMPRDQAVMPYWVPQVLRSHKKVVKRQQSFKGVPAPLDVRSGYNRWRICGEGRHLLKWQQLQALPQAGPVASGQPESPPASLLPLNLSLLTLLHALLRVMEAIRSPVDVRAGRGARRCRETYAPSLRICYRPRGSLSARKLELSRSVHTIPISIITITVIPIISIFIAILTHLIATISSMIQAFCATSGCLAGGLDYSSVVQMQPYLKA